MDVNYSWRVVRAGAIGVEWGGGGKPVVRSGLREAVRLFVESQRRKSAYAGVSLSYAVGCERVPYVSANNALSSAGFHAVGGARPQTCDGPATDVATAIGRRHSRFSLIDSRAG